MEFVKKGDIVSRVSYNNDIIFFIEQIITFDNGTKMAILKGVAIRIEADAPIEDLKLCNKDCLDEQFFWKNHDKNSRYISNYREYGKILHLDGDRNYSEKTIKYYEDKGLNFIVKHIAEHNQPMVIKTLLRELKPNILVITGHDGMIRKGRNYQDINNYRNSKYFYKSVREARSLIPNKDELIIFAGACQSFYEALISAGANFASSPARILIDFVDPLVVAEKVSITNRNKIILMSDLEDKIRNGRKAISGIGARGKCL